MNIVNQKPAVLSPVYTANIMGDFDPIPYIKETLATPLYVPVIQNQQVEIKDNGTDVTKDTVTQMTVRCMGDNIDNQAEDWCKELYGKTLINFKQQTHLTIRELFPMQAAVKENLPFPTPTIMYNAATDVVPIARKMLAGQVNEDYFFASLAFFARPKILGFYFINELAFNDFKTWLTSQHTMLQATLPANTNQMMTDFLTGIKLSGLTEGLCLRKNDSDNNDEMSFARLIVAMLMNYTMQVSASEFGVLPFDLAELYCPLNILFVNVEKHAHANASQVNKEWNMIQQSLQTKINMISNNRLTKLTATAKAAQRAATQAANALNNQNATANRMARTKFRKTRPTMIDITKCIKKVLSKMNTNMKTMNVYRAAKTTFSKANRRDPDDFNKKGIAISTKYKPDIHVYVDTSGSISERDYQDAIKALIQMSRKLGVDMYFNSFSHIMSQCTKLPINGRSTAQIYAAFQKVPKVSGGTDYIQIWNYINKTKKRKRELSLIITDFEWTAPSYVIPHPENLYYIPCSTFSWSTIQRNADGFVKSMEHNDPAIRSHLLF